MKVYYDGKPYEWQFGSEDLKTQLELVGHNSKIYLVGENLSAMVDIREIHFHYHEKEKESV